MLRDVLLPLVERLDVELDELTVVRAVNGHVKLQLAG
jgi:hypothetical protein